MKIEKISDNQIRCTLTRADLAERQLQLSELAYGTEKAKSAPHRIRRNGVGHRFKQNCGVLSGMDFGVYSIKEKRESR